MGFEEDVKRLVEINRPYEEKLTRYTDTTDKKPSGNAIKGVAHSVGGGLVYGTANAGINLANAIKSAGPESMTTQLDFARPAVENGINYYDYAKQMEMKYGNYMNDLMTDEERTLLYGSKTAMDMGIMSLADLDNRRNELEERLNSYEQIRKAKSGQYNYAMQNIDDAYELGKVGEFAQDAGSAIGFMAPSIAVGALTKNPSLALGTMATMGGAQGYGQAKDAGATHGQAAAYGIASGALEAGIERLGGGALGKIYGKGLDDVLLKKLGKDAIDNKTLKGVGINTARTMAGEGIEEGLATAADPFLQRATYDPNAENASLKEIGYNAGLGAAVGTLLGGGASLTEYGINKKRKSPEEIVAEIKSTTPNSAPNEAETQAEVNTPINGTKPLETKMQSAEQTMPSAEENAQIEKEFKTFADLALNKMHLRKVYDDMPMNRNAYIQGDVVHINKNKMTAEDIPTLKRVLAHEIYHSIESTKEGQRIYELAVEGQDANALLQAKYDEYLAEGITLDEAGQRAEVAADFIEKAMTDEATINRILTEDRTVIAKIVEYIKDVIEAIKAKRTKTPEDTQELIRLQKARRQYETALAKVQKGEYEAGFYGEEGEVRTQSKGLFTDAPAQSASVEVRNSIRSLRHDTSEGKMREDLIAKGGMSEGEADAYIKNLNKLADHIESFQSAFLDSFEEYGKEGRVTLPYKDNSDPLYKISLDFSTLCKKRIITQALIESLQVKRGKALSAEEQIAIRDYLKELKETNDKIEVACAMCYVEAARLRTPKWINKFIENPTAVVQKYLSTKNPANKQAIKDAGTAKRRELGYDDNTTLKDIKAKSKEDWKAVKAAQDAVKDNYKSTDPEEVKVLEFLKNDFKKEMVLTASGMMELKQKQPTVYTAFNAYLAGKAKSKALQTSEPYYYGDSSAVSDELIEQMNEENGLRHNSWSDFEMLHLLDLLVAVTELSVRGAKMQYYSKVPAEFRVLKNTNAMGNISLVPRGATGLDENGNLDFDPVEGVDFDEAKTLRRECSKTAGTIAIGINDAQITALLESDYIDYVIPYHTSGLSKMLRKMVGIEGWQDYQDYQNEKQGGNNASEPIKFSEWFHPTQEEIASKSGIEIMREAQAEYLRLCKERGLQPKFSNTKEGTDFTTHENYWKLLIDRKMIDSEGKIIIQEVVKPNFDFEDLTNLVTEQSTNSMQESVDAGVEAVEKWEAEGGLETRVKELQKENKQQKAKTEGRANTKDSQGRELSAGQQEYFKNSKVRDAEGNLLVMYHGTANGGSFNEFESSKLSNSSRLSQIGQGFYFTNVESEAKTYTKNVDIYGRVSKGENPHLFEVYLNVEKPFVIGKDTLDLNIAKQIYLDGDYEWFFESGIPHALRNKVMNNGEKYTESELKQMSKKELVSFYVDALYNDGGYYNTKNVLSNMIKAYKSENQDALLKAMKKHLGADGIMEEIGLGKYQYVVFSSEQIKNVDNTNPTSSKDIRYSVGKLDDAVEKKVPYKFYENTFQNTPIFDAAVKEAELLYGHERERVSEKETIEEAKRRLEENGWEKEMRSLSRKKDLYGADTDVAMGIMSHMNDFEVGTDEFDRLMRFSEDYAEKTVEAGQFIQALAKYSRTPAGLTQKGVRDVKREQKKVQEENPKKWNKAEKNAVEINNTVKKAQEDSINEVLDAVAKKVDEKTAEKILTKPKKEKKNKKKDPAESLAAKISLHVEPKDDTIANAQLQKDIVNELYKLAKESPLPEIPVAKQKKDYVAHLVKILQNYNQYEDVWYDAKEILIKKYKDDSEKMKALEDYFNNYAIPIYSKASLNNAIADQMKTLGVKWNDLLFDTKATQQEKESKIKDALLNELGVEDNEMLDVITNDIMHSLNTKVAEKAKKYLEQREKPKDEKDTKARVTAEEKIIRLVKKGIYNPDEARRLVQSAFDVPTLTSEDMKNVMAYYEKAAEYEEGSYEYRKWNSKAQSIIANKTPKTKAEKHNSYRRIMMLLNPTTWARNIGGNVMFGSVEAIKNIPGGAIDVLVAKKTGVRTTSANPFADIKAFYEGAKKGTAEWARDFAEGVDTSANAVREEYQLTSGKTWSDAKAYGRFLNKLEKVMSKGLQIGDRPIYEGAYAQRLNELKRLGYDTELETVQNMAKEYALERVFQNNSKISDAVISVRNRLGWFGRIILPFAQTPGNILDKTIDYSAVGGFVRAAGQLKTASKTGVFDQKLFVDRMGRVFTGAGLITMGYLLAKSGLLVGGEDDNYKVRQAERLGGKKKYALHIDGKYYTIDWASPTAAVLLAGAEGYEAGLEEDDFLAIAAASGQAMINSIFATSLLSNLETLMSGGYGDDPDIAKAITDAIIGAASQYFPAIVRKANNVFDPVQRDTYDPNALKAQWKYLQSGVPYFSTKLEPKYDIEGKVTMKSQGRGIGNRVAENFIFPMNVSTEYHSKVNDELLRLYEATGETNQLLRSASKKLNLGESGTYVLEAKEHNDMQKFMGVNSVREIEKLMASSTYKQMDDETKAESIGDIVGFYENQYKDNYAKKNKIEYENKSYQELKKKVADAGSWANYFANNNAFGFGTYESKVERKELCDKYKIEYDTYQSISDTVKDAKEKNKSIEKASKKADANRKAVAQALYDADLTDIQRQALWEKIGGYDGKTSMTYKQAVRAYGVK